MQLNSMLGPQWLHEQRVRSGRKGVDSALSEDWVLWCFSLGGTAASYFLLVFLCLFLSIFPSFIVEIKFIGFALEEEGEENREVKECTTNGMLLMNTGNTGRRKSLGKLGDTNHYITESLSLRAHGLYLWGVTGRQLGLEFRKEIESKATYIYLDFFHTWLTVKSLRMDEVFHSF